MKTKETGKRSKYHDLCARDAYFFAPLAFHLWGGLGPSSAALLKRIIRQVVGDAEGWAKIHRSTLIRHRLSVALLRAVADQLLPGLSIVPSFNLPPGLLHSPPNTTQARSMEVDTTPPPLSNAQVDQGGPAATQPDSIPIASTLPSLPVILRPGQHNHPPTTSSAISRLDEPPVFVGPLRLR